MKIKSVNPEYTGGGIYVFTGKVDNNYFMADTGFYDVRLLNADPDAETESEIWPGIMERNIDSVEWQEKHLVKDLTPSEAVTFFKDMLSWVKANKPGGNYLLSDMDYYENELDTLVGNWR